MQEESAAAVINPRPAGKPAASVSSTSHEGPQPRQKQQRQLRAGAVLPAPAPVRPHLPLLGWGPPDPSDHTTERVAVAQLGHSAWSLLGTSVEEANSEVPSSGRASIRKKPFTGQAAVRGSDSAAHHLLQCSRRAGPAQVSATTASPASTECWRVPREVLATK